MLVTFGHPIWFRLPSNPWFIRQYTWVLLQNISSVCWSRLSLFMSLDFTRGAQMRGGGERGHTGGETFFADFCARLLWREIYCAKPRPNAGSQSGFRSRRGLGIQAPRILCEYDLATKIAIQPLIHTLTCKIGSSIFAAMCRLKTKSTTRAYLPSMPPTERIIVEIFSIDRGSA